MFNTVCHFEIPADDVESLQRFYTRLFGWTFEKAPGPFNYYFIHTGSENLDG
ncbi:MAG: VOC family protein, partial [Deltaproteobacteria bacterium]|nr:VOC family protein [Deltaproteobacteria bacterium]